MSDMKRVQRATPARIEELGAMLDTVYRPQLTAGQGMPREFPHLFDGQNAHNIYYVTDAGRPVSMVAVLHQEVVFGGISLPVASIGSVVTLPEYQGQQLSSQILDEVVADLTAQQVPLMLVSGDRGLYRRIHCVPVGQMLEVACSRDETKRLRNELGGLVATLEIAPARRASLAGELVAIYQAEAYRYRRTAGQMEVLLNALWFQRSDYDQRLFTFVVDGEIVSYAVAYTTHKSPNEVVVMEWAGSRTAFLSGLHDMTAAFGATRVRWHGHVDDVEMNRQIRSEELQTTSLALQGTVRLLDVERLFQTLAPILLERFGATARVTQSGESWRVELGDKVKEFSQLEEIASWVFNRNPDSLGLPFVHTDDLNYI